MSEYEPIQFPYSPEVQRIANKLPTWTKARKEKDSLLQQYMLPAGETMEHLVGQIELYLRNRFPELANLDDPDLMKKIYLPGDLRLNDPTIIENHLGNSSFEILTSHDRLPDLWRSEGDGTVDITTGILGDRGISLLTASSQTAALYQEVEGVPIKAGDVWCFYIWYRSRATGLTAPSTGFGLEVVGTLADGSTETLRAAFVPDTSGYPRRAYILSSFSQNVVKWKFRVVVTNSGSFPITTTVDIDMAMAAKGDRLVNWKPNPFDKYPYIDFHDHLAPLVIEQGTRAQYVERMSDFWLDAVPTRADGLQMLSSGGTQDPSPSAGADGFTVYDSGGSHSEADYWDKNWEFEWQIGTDGSANPKVRGYGTIAPDVLGPFDLAFRNWRNWFEDGISWTPEAMTVLHGYVWIVLKKQDHLGNTKRYLALVNPKTTRPFTSYLEASAMIELEGISTSIQLTRADVRYRDQQHLYVGNGEYEWSYVLHYDYFMISRDRNILYFREDYGDVVPQLMVPQRDLEVPAYREEG